MDFITNFTHVQYAFACGTAHVNSVCAYACPLPLWPERVVACRVSLSSVSSECDKLLSMESGLPDLFFVTISLGFARFFYEHALPMHLIFLPSRSFSPAQTTFLFEFFVTCPNLHCFWRPSWEFPHKYMLHGLVWLWSSIHQHTKHIFSSSEGHLCISERTKTSNFDLLKNMPSKWGEIWSGIHLHISLWNDPKKLNTLYIYIYMYICCIFSWNRWN